MNSREPVIRVAGLRKAYGERTAVDSVGFEVSRGELFGLLGPNGAGKSSIVEILSGHRVGSGGAASVLGEDPATAGRRWRNRIGIVPQTGADHDGWRVGELVGQIGRCYSDALPTAEVLDLVDLGDRARSTVTALSGGQRRRLDLALGIVGRPEVLFLDEPSTGLDPEARQSCWALIGRLRDAGTSILLTTHYMDEAERLADRVAVLAGGRILQEAPPSAIGASEGETEVSWREHGTTRRLLVHEVEPLLGALRERLGGEVPGLEVRRASLEARYLRLIGTEENA